MRKACVALACAVALTAAHGVRAQTYPSRPVTIVVGFAAGGPSDTIARILVEPMRRALGQPVIVENVTGAGGSIGILRAVRATPDGYTLNLGNWTTHVGGSALHAASFDVLNDLAPVAPLPSAPLLLVGRGTLPPNNVPELIAWLQAHPGQATAGIVGFGSGAHVCGIDFQNKTGTRFQFVPYRGGAPAMQDLLAGQIDLRPGTEASTALPYLRDRKLKGYAVLARTRWRSMPDLPTIDEGGVPGLHIALWHGLWAPRDTPSDIVAKVSAAVAEAWSDPVVRQRLDSMGMDLPRPEQQTPGALAAFHKAEVEKWWPIIKAAGIKAQ